MIKKTFTLDRKKVIALTFLVFTISMLSLQMIRFSKNNSLIGDEPYYHLRIAREIAESGFIHNDSLLDSNPKYYFNLIDYILSFLPQKILLMIIIPFILGAITLLLFYFILSEFNINENQKFFSCILLIMSPPFIYSFSSYNNFSFIVTFNILFAFLYMKKLKVLSFISVLPIMLISLPSIIITVTIAAIIDIINNNDRKKLLLFSSLLLLLSIVLYFLYYYPSFIPNRLFFSLKNILTSTVSDLGAVIGFSIFEVILLVIGIFVIRSKKRRFPYYIALLGAFFISVYFGIVLIFLNFFICFLASYALFEIYNKNWEIQALKNITITLIIYGLLFSTFSYETRLVNISPIADEIGALNFLSENPPGVVLSHYSNGFLIEYFSNKPVLLDDRIYTLNKGPSSLNISDTIFYSRNIAYTKDLLSKNSITYIYINDEMTNGLVWDKRNEGLLFLLDHSSSFQRIYLKNNIEIWKFINTTN